MSLILIPLGGKGERFKQNNYDLPKAFINIFGKKILYYLLDSLHLNKNDHVCIPYHMDYKKYSIEEQLTHDYPNIHFIFYPLTRETEGAAETINIALQHLNIPDCPVLCLDADNFYTVDIVKCWNGKNKVITFEDKQENPMFSYVQLHNNQIIDIVEKNKISNHACCGAYGFSSYKELLLYTGEIILKNIRQKNEFYTSNVIKLMLDKGIIFENHTISQRNYICLGTPLQVKIFYNNYPNKSCIDNEIKLKRLRFCFDLDNTLVTYPKIDGDYTTVEPIQKNIDYLNYLKSFGHIIIIHTARRMKTHNSNVGKIMADIGKITLDTLDKFKIQYDEIYFGKPYADFYIDDKALNCFDDMEKNIGFYMDDIKPRFFNQIQNNIIETITKQSESLDGEIHYYNNIPHKIKDLFPLMISYDHTHYKEYTMEKINGIAVSTLYLSELLTTSMLNHICGTLNRLHTIKNTHDNINIYANYCNKLSSRFEKYDYTKFQNYELVYNQIYHYLESYEKNNEGICSMIHGDFVMTNIIINHYDKIKIIDMRGKIGDTLTVYGDIFYDWAKLYQSLIGYDEILQNKDINKHYKKLLIEHFETIFLQQYNEKQLNNVKMITKSLLFSLIPLHNNEKCIQYFNLITSF